MAGSVNKVTLVGRLGREPETKTFSNGNSVVKFSVATSEGWKDKASGEWKEKTEWHNVSVFNEHFAEFAMRQLHKGSLVYLEGQLQTSKGDVGGVERTFTEVVVPRFKGELKSMDSKAGGEQSVGAAAPEYPLKGSATAGAPRKVNSGIDDLDDSIPF